MHRHPRGARRNINLIIAVVTVLVDLPRFLPDRLPPFAFARPADEFAVPDRRFVGRYPQMAPVRHRAHTQPEPQAVRKWSLQHQRGLQFALERTKQELVG